MIPIEWRDCWSAAAGPVPVAWAVQLLDGSWIEVRVCQC